MNKNKRVSYKNIRKIFSFKDTECTYFAGEVTPFYNRVIPYVVEFAYVDVVYYEKRLFRKPRLRIIDDVIVYRKTLAEPNDDLSWKFLKNGRYTLSVIDINFPDPDDAQKAQECESAKRIYDNEYWIALLRM